MKTISIQAVKEGVTRLVSPKKLDKVADVAVKDGEKMVAAGQDGVAAYNKAAIKVKSPYVKPNMQQVEVKPKKLAAGSYDPRTPDPVDPVDPDPDPWGTW